jgi:hypothetical protein
MLKPTQDLIASNMKKTLLIQVFVSLILNACSSQQTRTHDIVFNDSAFIKLTVTNCSDTTEFSYKTSPMLPRGCVIKKIEITRDTVYYFSHKTTKPDFIDLELRKEFQTYVIPGDTLKIVANLDPNISDDNAIQIEDELGEIMNYFSKKHESLGYRHISFPLTNFSNISNPIKKAFSLSDSLFKSELGFLDYYNSTTKLPDWFYKTMKEDLEYNKVLIRPYLISYRKFFFKEEIINPEAYYIFDQIRLYNPNAKLSDYYYQCIDTYLWVNRQQGLEGKRGIDRGLPLFERSIPEAKEVLKGEILEYYLAWRISESFAVCRNINELTRVDSLYNSLKTQIENDEIIKIINNQRDYMAEYFESLKNNPFTFTKIIPIDN